MVILYATLSLKKGAEELRVLVKAAVQMILGRATISTTAWDASMARVAMDESMVLLVLGGASLLFSAQVRRDAQAKQSALAEARQISLLHEFGRRLAKEGPELVRMHETILDVPRLLPQTEMALVILPDPPDHAVRVQHHPTLQVFASTSARHPVGERLADLKAPCGLQRVSGMGAGYVTPLPSNIISTYASHLTTILETL
jgi:hypothetical protein